MVNDSIYNDEVKLIQLVTVGDEVAFTVLFKRYAPLLKLNINRLIKDGFGSSEVLQETFIKIWLNREKLLDIQNPRAYFNKIALHQCFNYLNRLANQNKIMLAPDVQESLTSGPEENLAYKETEIIIQTAIEELPAQRKAIYELSRNEGMNSFEIARELNITPDYVRQAISAARRHIKEKLIQAGKLLVAFPIFF